MVKNISLFFVSLKMWKIPSTLTYFRIKFVTSLATPRIVYLSWAERIGEDGDTYRMTREWCWPRVSAVRPTCSRCWSPSTSTAEWTWSSPSCPRRSRPRSRTTGRCRPSADCCTPLRPRQTRAVLTRRFLTRDTGTRDPVGEGKTKENWAKKN